MIWIIGAGSMAREYVKVLQALELPCRVIGRSEARARQLADDTGVDVVAGGLAPFLQSAPDVAGHAIVCTPVDQLAPVSQMLMHYGVKSLLVEKPAAIDRLVDADIARRLDRDEDLWVIEIEDRLQQHFLTEPVEEN